MNDRDKRKRTFFNFSTWAQRDFLVSTADDFRNKARELFRVKNTSATESFDEALNRLHMTEKDLLERATEYRRLLLLFFLVTLGLVSYTVYVLLQGHFMGFLMSAGLTVFSGAMTFRYHFWLFQIQKRRLGCSVREWFQQGVLGRRS